MEAYLGRLIGRLAPFFSLAGGIVTVALLRRGVSFAPISAMIALVAWIAAVGFSPLLRKEQQAPGEPVSKKTRAVRFVSRAFVTGLYQNVLFFIVPVWFGSATLLSPNIAFPLLLAGLALYSCFDASFAAHVLSRPLRRNAVSALILFAVSVPALCVLTHLPVRIAIALCGGLAVFFAALFGGTRTRFPVRVIMGVPLAALIAGGMYLGAIWLPPVPVQCMERVAGTGIVDRVTVGTSDTFPRGTPKIWVHFAVAAPDRYHQDIRFQWYLDGETLGRPIPSKIVGGRKQGFRTWTFRSRPAAGRYRVDLLTGDDQLIGRVTFRVK